MRMRWADVLSRVTLVALAGGALNGCVSADQPALTGPAVQDTHLDRGPVAPARVRSRPLGPVADAPSPRTAATAAAASPWAATSRAAAAATAPAVEARVLVLSADGGEADLPAIRQALDYLGTPYTVRIATTAGALTPDQLAVDGRGRYQGVILTTAALAFYDGAGWRSALAPDEWQTLWTYEAAYGVRQVTWYTYPTPDYGFAWGTAVDTSATPVEAALTDAGREVFPYVAAGARLTVRDAYAYLAAPASATATPLLTDGAGNALALVERYADGRENLALTFDSSPHLIHAIVLSYGLVDWVTRGVFLGERHTYLSAHVDDVFYGNDLYGGGEYRMTGDDLRAVVSWQREHWRRPLTAGVRLDMVFNGEGSVAGQYDPDTLTPVASLFQGEFKWVNHTYQHLNLDAISYDGAHEQVRRNNQVAQRLRLGAYNRANLVTGQVSGLYNPAAMRAAADLGVRYVVSDTSRPGEDNPSPNAGIHNALQPSILMIPRRPTNLFYNVSTPDEWAAEYNAFYRGYWGRDLSYDEILDRETDVLVRYVLRGEIDPWMFHQANLRAYDGTHTLLGDLVDRVVARYGALVNLPIVSPTMDETGRRVEARMRYNAANVRALIVPGQSITLLATSAAVVPVTGVASRGSESYGGETISYVSLSPGTPVTLRLP